MTTKIDFTMQELLASGAHFGHVREKYNPKMKEFIFGLREGVHLIDLEKTVKNLSKALEYIASQKEQGKNILFVCTKSGISSMVRELAIELDMPFVTYRWPGGMLTNFETLKKQIKKFNDLDLLTQNEEKWSKMTKKEKSSVNKEIEKLTRNFEGVKKLTKVPDNVFIIDTINEKTAITEARKMKIPVIAIVDTNSDPGMIDFPIPANDDAKKGLELILGEVRKVLS
uniref:Small ribosomal subunit protein uS2 n=1 Tax=candidate division CPR3 bacterium TaxID=2268181 RepID=A0A7C4R591_UNCC3